MRPPARIRGRIALAVLGMAVWAGVSSGGVLATGAASNDSFASAIVLTGADASRAGDTNVGATLEPGEAATVAGSPAGASVWYSWTAPQDGEVVIDTATSGFDTLLGVYTGLSVGSLGDVASNDDFQLLTSRVRFPATSGTVYRIRVDGYSDVNGTSTGTINLNVHQAPPPSNDDFADAVVLSSAQNVSRAGDTNDGATLETGEDTTVAGFPAGASVWYAWTAPATGEVAIDTATSTFDTLVGVYTGGAVDTLVDVASNDDAKVPPTSLVRFSAISGHLYMIRVDGFRETSGTINLHLKEVLPASSPANDNFGSAVALPSVMSTSRTGDTNAGAALQSGEAATVAGEPASGSVWYSWTAPGPGTATIDTATSAFDTLLGVYTGTLVTALTSVASNDDVGKTDLTSSVRFPVTGGTTYRIRVDGYAGDTGAITLHLKENLPPANDDFADAFILSGPDDARLSDTNVAATRQAGAGEAATVDLQPASTSVWYSWTAPQSTPVTINTANSDFDTLLGVYTGNAVGSLVDVVSNNDAATGDHTSKVAFAAIGGTSYRIRVDGYSGATGTIKLHVALATVSTVPTNVTATAGDQQATVNWSAPVSDGGSPITGYNVTRYEAGVLPVTTHVGTVTQLIVGGLTNGTTYTFRIAAINAIGTGAQSYDSNPVTPSTVPDAPTNVSATPGAGQATVHWSAPAFNGGSPITAYDVTRYVGGSAQGTTTVGAVTQATVGGLTNGTAYTFKVAAKNIAGAGALSDPSAAVTPRTVPGAPTSVSATAGVGQATVNWTAPTSDGGSAITGYDVTGYVGGVAQSTTSLGLVTQATLGGLTNGTTYTFKVAARNVAGPGALSAASNAVVPRTVPDAPTSVSAVTGVAQATVSWSAGFDGGSPITGYDVTSYVAGVAQGTTSVGLVAQTTINGLTNGTVYTFRVVAKNAIGTGATSSDSNAVTPRTVPDAPTSVSALTAGAGQALVTWSAPSFNGGDNVAGYEITSYSAGVARGKITVGVVNQATFGGLTNGTTYTFRVAAKNVAGTGAPSADSNSVTPFVPKHTLTINKSGAGAGTVTSSVGAINCGASCTGDLDQGTIVTLTAVASSGSTFAGWSGSCTGVGSCTVPIDAAKTATAKFDLLPSPKQPAAKCVVPNVKRKPLATAKRKIVAAHCTTGKITKAKSKTVRKGRVISQKTPAGKKLAAGSKVSLVISRGKR